MTAYADYTFYTTTFAGTAIASTEFTRLANRASQVLDQLTFDRTAPVVTANTDTVLITKIKNATCEIAEEIKRQETAGNADGKTSESVGSYSVSFGANSRATMTNRAKWQDAARFWLSGTELMFKGFAAGEYGSQPDAD